MAHTHSRIQIAASDNIEIQGTTCSPESGSDRAVLLLHGITTQKDEYGNFYKILAERFADLGLATLRIDFRGHGESTVSSRAFSVASQVLDARAAVQWLREHAKAHDITLFGCSFGCPPALYLAEMFPELVDRIILLSPVLDYVQTFLKPTTDWASSLFNEAALSEAYRTGTLSMTDGFQIDVKLLVEMAILKPFESLERSPQRKLVIHGTADSMVPFRITAEKCSGIAGVEVAGMEGMEHGYTDVEDDEGVGARSLANLEAIVAMSEAFIAH